MAKLDSYVPREKVDVPDNVYFALIKKIERKVWSADNINFNWTFEIAQPPFLGKKVWVWGTTGTIPTPKAHLTLWASVLGYSREQMADPSFDTDVFVGTYVKIILQTWQKENGEMKQGVKGLLPMTDVDQQILQKYLAESQVTGQAKVAAQVTPAPTPIATSLPQAPVFVNPAPSPMQPLATPAPVAQPVAVPVAAPAPVVQPAVAPVATPKRSTSFPF